jgi:hypothetical protein
VILSRLPFTRRERAPKEGILMTRVSLRSVSIATSLLAAIAAGTPAFASDTCLGEFQDETGVLASGSTVCQVASGKSCTFNLQLCLNGAEEGCEPASFPSSKKFHATGHCGPVRKVFVAGAGTSSVCGDPAPVKLRTKGSHPGKCTITSRIRTAKTNARTDVDTIKLLCQPTGSTCPSTTTTSTTTSTTTTTAP